MLQNKRLMVMIALVASVLIGTALFTILAGFTWDALFVVIIVALFLVYAIPKYIINRNDLVTEDEYTKKVLQLAASRSYLISIYTWLAMMWFSEILDDNFEATTTKIGIGIGIMAIVFLINILVIKATGLKE